ncbi:hypothetical protein E4U58_001629 [Claviceps cyperi]|nr:hypothetical protein E4U58_001629 [Claviceps cyperi]
MECIIVSSSPEFRPESSAEQLVTDTSKGTTKLTREKANSEGGEWKPAESLVSKKQHGGLTWDATQDDAHIESERQHHPDFESDGVRYRAHHSRRHRSMPSTPVMSPRASFPASSPSSAAGGGFRSWLSGGLFRTTVHVASIIARRRYIIKLCHVLMIYGAPTHR